jgi:hypothetical protein
VQHLCASLDSSLTPLFFPHPSIGPDRYDVTGHHFVQVSATVFAAEQLLQTNFNVLTNPSTGKLVAVVFASVFLAPQAKNRRALRVQAGRRPHAPRTRG